MWHVVRLATVPIKHILAYFHTYITHIDVRTRLPSILDDNFTQTDADRVKARRRLRYPKEERGLLHSTDEQRDKLPRNCRTGGQSTGRLSQKQNAEKIGLQV